MASRKIVAASSVIVLAGAVVVGWRTFTRPSVVSRPVSDAEVAPGTAKERAWLHELAIDEARSPVTASDIERLRLIVLGGGHDRGNAANAGLTLESLCRRRGELSPEVCELLDAAVLDALSSDQAIVRLTGLYSYQTAGLHARRPETRRIVETIAESDPDERIAQEAVSVLADLSESP